MALGSTLVNSTDLDTIWAQRNDVRAALPTLIRRLIRATSFEVSELYFPSDEATQLDGWDGVAMVEAGNDFVPSGRSLWELGSNSDITTKANEDYAKRTRDPRGFDPAESIYVFVTPRRWPGKTKWLRQRNEEHYWKEVRAYDAVSLEHWLELAPSVHIWLSVRIGKHPEGARDLDTFWTDWAEAASPISNPDLILAGRDTEVQRIHDWLNSNPSVIAVKGDSRDEVLAVFAALVWRLTKNEAETFAARTLIVEDPSTWTRLEAMTSPLILIANFNVGSRLNRAVKNGHHVLVALGKDEPDLASTLVLPRLKRQAVAEILLATGVRADKVEDLAKLARRSLLAFRRKLASVPEVQQPTWATPSEARTLVPLMIAGMWNDSAPGDQRILGQLAKSDYASVSNLVARWTNEPDPPLRRIGSHVILTSKEDAWLLLARFVNQADISLLHAKVMEVLGELHPKFELQANQQWLVGIHGKNRAYSGLLRQGLAETLAVMAVSSDIVNASNARSGQDHVNSIVGQLLERANKDWHLWASLNDVLPILAEAAPDEFLHAVELGLSSDHPLLMNVFSTPDDPLFGSSSHTGLLWALEALAWSADYLGFASRLLAKMTRLDPNPDSQHANRPANSLKGIYLVWFPQTTADWRSQLQVLDTLLFHEPDVSWALLLSILPMRHGIGHPSAQLQWRDWGTDPNSTLDWPHVWSATTEVVDRLVNHAGTNGQRWGELVNQAGSLPPELQNRILDTLTTLDKQLVSDEDKALVQNKLRSLLSHHKSFPDAEWALPAPQLVKLDEVYKGFEPTALGLRYAWLFSDTARMPDIVWRNWEEQEEGIANARRAAIEDVYEDGAQQGLLAFARIVERPIYVGHALGLSDQRIAGEAILLDGLASEDAVLQDFTSGFVSGRLAKMGIQWGQDLISSPLWKRLSPKQKAALFLHLPRQRRTWDYVDENDPDVQRFYWTSVSSFISEDCELAIEQFLKYEMPYTAVRALAFCHEQFKGRLTLIVRTLDDAIQSGIALDTNLHSIAHEIGDLIDELAQSNDMDGARLAKYEWFFIPLLAHIRAPKTLYTEMANNPTFFVELLRLTFKARGEEPRTPSKEEAARAHSAFELLNSWKNIPGLRDDGSIDADHLKDWTTRSRELYTDCDRVEIGDQIVGQILSSAPGDSDGVWPAEPVREIIENLGSQDLETGILTGTINSRGVTWRSPNDGGKQEHTLADNYRQHAAALSNRWPKTAGVLRKIADSYEAQARDEDIRAELNEDL